MTNKPTTNFFKISAFCIMAAFFSCASLSTKVEPKKLLTYCSDQDGAKYCINEQEGSSNLDFIVFMHGFLDNEKAYTESYFKDAMARMEEFRNEWGNNAPKVLLISYGRSFLLTRDKRSTMPQDATVPNILEVIKKLEKKHNLTGNRYLMGISMGGQNAGHLLFYAPSMWKKAVLLAPFWPKCDPFKIWGTSCVTRKFELLINARNIIMANYPTPDDWSKHDAINYMKLAEIGVLPPTMLSTGTNDEWLFYDKSLEFSSIARDRGWTGLTWHPHGKDHLWWDVKKVIAFLKQ